MKPMELYPASQYANVDFRSKTSAMPIKRVGQEPLALPAREGEPMALRPEADPVAQQAELKEKFQEFVGQTFFTELIKSLRTSQQGAAYFNGGQAEKVFQGQFDQMMSEHLSEASAQSISDPMFELFQLGRMSG
jgi:hypothetical protein